MNKKPATSRVETAVPHPPVEHFSERQKEAIDLSAEAEHAHGPQREALTRKAEGLGQADARGENADRAASR